MKKLLCLALLLVSATAEAKSKKEAVSTKAANPAPTKVVEEKEEAGSFTLECVDMHGHKSKHSSVVKPKQEGNAYRIKESKDAKYKSVQGVCKVK